MGKLTYILLLTVIWGIFFASCDRKDDSVHIENLEGHWLYVDTQIDIVLSDTSLIRDVRSYIAKNYMIRKASYEFKSNRTYYMYLNHSEPLRGNYEIVNKKYFVLDDIRGFHRVVHADSLIYVLTDMRRDIAKGLNIDENRILKADFMEIFERGLATNH